jgi:WhiB family redox-sensing transcriptional regulator
MSVAFIPWPGTALFAAADDEPLGWMDLARCAETDPDSFFPRKGDSSKPAKAICRGCEVREECLEFALAHSGPEDVGTWGVWGGLSAPERAALQRERGLPQPAARRGDRCRNGHFRTSQNTEVFADCVRCKDCERTRYLASSRETAA